MTERPVLLRQFSADNQSLLEYQGTILITVVGKSVSKQPALKERPCNIQLTAE
jgi:hypothetical protein